MSDKPDNMTLRAAYQMGSELHLDLWYPRNPESEVKSFVIGLQDVRAADDIRVSYDFDRDGWKIEQSFRYQWESSDENCGPVWLEVAFVQTVVSIKAGDAPL